ncbi:hypothetical protein T07_13116 [Trichinella nelsoni]|uniref:Uncharacterized protein n=1 Tax=Trichinella nelsoni TaxID=6336 RepID=A0A0V0RP75_9BILA|nr:hypothetical protein T07_13116 [Trichinella nelsoni]
METFLKTENLRILPKALHDQWLYLRCSQNLENYLELHISTMVINRFLMGIVQQANTAKCSLRAIDLKKSKSFQL